MSIATDNTANAVSGDRCWATTPAQLFVVQTSLDFLNSWAPNCSLGSQVQAYYYDAKGVGHSVDATTVAGRAEYVNTLAKSDPWLGATVDQFYLATLGRPADASGKAYWVSILRSGRSSVATVGSQFYASDEYFNHIGGGTLQSWVGNLYSKLLGRPADSAGQKYWVTTAQRAGRFNVAYAFFQTSESCQHRVKVLYSKLLGRTPDQDGLDYWAKQVAKSGDIALATSLASSAEYLARSYRPFVSDLDLVAGHYRYRDSFGINGTPFKHSLALTNNDAPEFNMSRDFKHLVGSVGVLDTQSANVSMNVKIYVDGVQKYNQNVKLGQKLGINISVANGLRLKLLVKCVSATCAGGAQYTGFGDLQLLPY